MRRTPGPILLWFRRDLRLTGNPALERAIAEGGTIVPIFVDDPDVAGVTDPRARAPVIAATEDRRPGSASRAWLVRSIESLDEDLRKRGSRLVIRKGRSLDAIRELARECDAKALFYNRQYDPAGRAAEAHVEAMLRAEGVSVASENAALLLEPGEIATASREPFRVFSSFHRRWLRSLRHATPSRAPKLIPAPERWPRSIPAASLGAGRSTVARPHAMWRPGEAGARARLERFLEDGLLRYAGPVSPAGRDRPDLHGTSRLSPHLAFGEIGPRQILHEIERRDAQDPKAGELRGVEAFLRQLAWREFAMHILYHFPHTVDRPLRPEFTRFPWSRARTGLLAWQRGETGFPIVDAAMRELRATGWMHNRSRMIVASFLTKDLRVSWADGARWFWENLVDADLANNSFGWQWAAGCGADAAPYFRIFNPVLQGMRFDPYGGYVRRWIPELAGLPDAWIHRPAEAPAGVLAAAGVKLGREYPKPIVDHAEAREEALIAFAAVRSGRKDRSL